MPAVPVPASFVFARGRSSTKQRANVYRGGRRLEPCCIPVQVSIKPAGMQAGADAEVHGPAGAEAAPRTARKREPRAPAVVPCPCPRCGSHPMLVVIVAALPTPPSAQLGSLGLLLLQHPCPGSSPSDRRSCRPPDLPKREGLARSKWQLCRRFSSFQLTLLPSAPNP